MTSCFIDTTTLVYAKDQASPSKQKQAVTWIKTLTEARAAVVSAQVVREYYWVVARKLTASSRELLREDVRDMQAWIPAGLELDHIEAGWVLQDRYKVGFWDALMLASAQIGGCRYFLSEDLQDGQDFDGVRVVNPFTASPQRVLEQD